MNHKVLLADDSLTIQKVIKITLANQPYDIKEVSSEEELFHQLPIVKPKIVFLDFNLSEKYTGYELTTKIKSILPTTKVLLLLGTFDTIDDDAMEKSGASEKIVKPFDSNRFIAICKQLIDTFADDELTYPESKPEGKAEANPEDQWTISHSTEQTFREPAKQNKDSAVEGKNILHDEVSDWGMSIPGVISDKASHNVMPDLPPVIGEVKSLEEHRVHKTEASKDENKYPDTDDLDYPTIEEMTVSSGPEEKPAAPKSKLLSIDSFNKPLDFEIEGNYVPDESDVKSIEDQIRDEVEEDLWKADEFEDDIKKEVSSKIEEVKSTFQPSRNDFDESLFKPIDDADSIKWEDSEEHEKPATETASEFFSSTSGTEPSLDREELKREMEEMVKKYVKEYMDEFFRKNAEKVAWEVIPDLAENLIRQELSKISNKILND